jgi:flagellar hook-associated protein 2
MAVFQAGGLASGMDTNSIVDQLVKLESAPIAALKKRQTGIKTRTSALADIVSKLQALETAAKGLKTDGVLAAKVTSANDAFSVTTGTGATGGRYAVEVQTLAKAARWRSAAFTSTTEGVAGGTLTLKVQGKTYDPIAITDGMTLADVAAKVRQSGAPVSAAVLTSQEGTFLSVTARDTGHPASGAADALSLAFAPAGGATGKLPGFAETEAAVNATVKVDGLTFSRTTNAISDVIPGVTLTLKKQAAPVEDLVLATDADGTKAKLQKFVDAYNDVMKLVQRQLNPAKDADRNATLAGDAAVRALQGKLSGVLTTQVPGLATVRTLADVGVKTGRDGSLSLDATAFSSALGRDPAAMDALFSTATSGLGDAVVSLVGAQTRGSTVETAPGVSAAVEGVLTARRTGLEKSVKDLDAQIAAMERRVLQFRENLVRQFTAMESSVSSLKQIGNYLASQQPVKIE